MAQDLIFIFYVWLLSFVLQLISIPFLVVFLQKKAIDSGLAFGRIIVWLFISLILWFLGHFNFAVVNSAGVWSLVFLLGIFSLAFWQKHKNLINNYVTSHKKILLTEELIFIIGLTALSLIRTYNPDILGLEKFMDVGLINSYLMSSTLPIKDIWLAGETVNYYSFGHFLGSVMVDYWAIQARYAYNLLLGLICGLLLTQSFSLVVNFVSHFQEKLSLKVLIKAGLVGAILVGIGGNSHTFWSFITKHSLKTYWYPDATRFISNTIHEFPSYSFIVSDLHAHVWSMPIVLLLIFIISLWLNAFLKSKKVILWSAIAGIILGVLIMTNTWDMLIYSLLLVLISLILFFINYKNYKKILITGFIIIITSLITSSFWWLNFKSIPQGIMIVTEQSPIWQLLVLWGGHLIATFLFMISALALLKKYWYKKEFKQLIKEQQFASLIMLIAITVLAWILLILPELIYVKDIYPNHPRANTMFKFTFQSFILMGLVIGSYVGFTKKLIIKIILFLFTLTVIIYPFFGYRDFYAGLKQHKSLDGLMWLEQKYPDDYLAILWMQSNIKEQVNIVEAVGESYTEFARVSTFTGLPTILGWRVHEWLWRGGFDIPRARTDEVKLIYEEPKSNATKDLLKKYDIKYIFVGSKEKEAYRSLDFSGLKTLGKIVFASNGTYIINLE